MKIGIDPGHGGKDPGAVANNVKEKEVNLAVALMLADLLISSGHSVVLTRYTDKFQELSFRSGLCNREKVDLVVSLHANAAPGGNPNPDYLSTYYYPGSGKGNRLAWELLDSLVRALGWRSGGVRKENFHMVRETRMPACLMELGFITNPVQARALTDPEFQERIAKAVKEGIERYAAGGMK